MDHVGQAQGGGSGNLCCQRFHRTGYGTDERTGRISLTGRRYCIEHERFTFWHGSLTLDRRVEGEREIEIYPACGRWIAPLAPSGYGRDRELSATLPT